MSFCRLQAAITEAFVRRVKHLLLLSLFLCMYEKIKMEILPLRERKKSVMKTSARLARPTTPDDDDDVTLLSSIQTEWEEAELPHIPAGYGGPPADTQAGRRACRVALGRQRRFNRSRRKARLAV